MTTTTSSLETQIGLPEAARLRRLATAAGRLLSGIGSRWNAFVEAGQLGPDSERSLSRHMGGRI